jgi:hypothetical protein
MSACDFLLNVAASFIPMLSASIYGYFKWWKPYQALKKTGIIKIHKDQKSAEQSIIKSIRSSRSICVFALKGATFSDKSTSIGKLLMNDKDRLQKYLISDKAENNQYVNVREKELAKSCTNGLSLELEYSYKRFANAQADNKSIEVKRHSEIVRFRIIILDDFLFLSFQEKHEEGKKSQMWQISKASPIYQTYKTYFDDLWTKYN